MTRAFPGIKRLLLILFVLMLPAAAMSYGAQLGGQLAPLTVEQAVHESK